MRPLNLNFHPSLEFPGEDLPIHLIPTNIYWRVELCLRPVERMDLLWLKKNQNPRHYGPPRIFPPSGILWTFCQCLSRLPASTGLPNKAPQQKLQKTQPLTSEKAGSMYPGWSWRFPGPVPLCSLLENISLGPRWLGDITWKDFGGSCPGWFSEHKPEKQVWAIDKLLWIHGGGPCALIYAAISFPFWLYGFSFQLLSMWFFIDYEISE